MFLNCLYSLCKRIAILLILLLLITGKEKIGQERHKNINHFFDASSGTSGSNFGDGSSSSLNVGVGQATATGCGHGNMHSLGRSVCSYGNYHHLQAHQQNHSVIKPSQQSFGSNSNTPPQLFNYVQPYYPSSGPSMGYIGLKNCVAGSGPNENTTTTTTLKRLFWPEYVEHMKYFIICYSYGSVCKQW